MAPARASREHAPWGGQLSWQLSPPVLTPAKRPEDPFISVKDPPVVFHGGRWHVFMTTRNKVRTHQIEYVSFKTWEETDRAPRYILRCREGYCYAPQVFYFRPHQVWYLVYQVSEPGRNLKLQPAYSTSRNVADPQSWTPARLLFPETDPEGVERWIDFWVICDEAWAWLFLTSLEGRMWRMWTPLDKFPCGFGSRELALRADIFEASHTYCLLGLNQYLTIVEAEGRGGRRYYKAYLANHLNDVWRPLADTTEERPFAGWAHIRQPATTWTDNISHGELFRTAPDETIPVNPNNLQFLIQGVLDQEKTGKKYGDIPWQLGLLTQVGK